MTNAAGRSTAPQIPPQTFRVTGDTFFPQTNQPQATQSGIYSRTEPSRESIPAVNSASPAPSANRISATTPHPCDRSRNAPNIS